MSKRYSPQRQMVLEAIRALDHPLAQDVLEEVRRHYSRMSLATVYRNLHALAAEGLIRRVLLPGSSERFDCLTSQHYHMVCERCGGVFDVAVEYFEQIDSAAQQKTGYSISGHKLQFQGVCARCEREHK